MDADRMHQLVGQLNRHPAFGSIPVSLSAGIVVALAIANILDQLPPQMPDIQWEHMTLEGALVIAVIVLWKSLSSAHAQLIENARAVTQALAASMELRKIIEELRLNSCPDCGVTLTKKR